MSNTKVYLAPMEGLTDYMFRNAFDEFFGHGKIDKYFMPFISPNQTEKFLAKEMRDIDRNNNLINSIPQIMTNNSEDFIWTAHMLFDNFGYNEINLNAGDEVEDDYMDEITDTVYRDFFGDQFVDMNVRFH